MVDDDLETGETVQEVAFHAAIVVHTLLILRSSHCCMRPDHHAGGTHVDEGGRDNSSADEVDTDSHSELAAKEDIEGDGDENDDPVEQVDVPLLVGKYFDCGEREMTLEGFHTAMEGKENDDCRMFVLNDSSYLERVRVGDYSPNPPRMLLILSDRQTCSSNEEG
jgi:hypothetical protein